MLMELFFFRKVIPPLHAAMEELLKVVDNDTNAFSEYMVALKITNIINMVALKTMLITTIILLIIINMFALILILIIIII